MTIREDLLEFGRIYESIKKEIEKILKKVKINLKDISDAEALQRIKNKKELYIKDDLLDIRNISKKYDIKISRLDGLLGEYEEIRKKLEKAKPLFEEEGFRDVSFSPFSLRASTENDMGVTASVKVKEKKLSLWIFSYEMDRELLGEESLPLEKKIESILDKKL